MSRFGIIGILVFITSLLGCDSSSIHEKDPKPVLHENPEIDENDIESLIHLHEYLKRENYGSWMSDERLQELKDSINYDSIMKNRKYPMHNYPDSTIGLNF